MASKSANDNIRIIGLSMFFSGIGFLLIFLLKKTGVEMSKLTTSSIAFCITSIAILIIFPKVLKQPFGKVSIREFFERLGVTVSTRWYAYVILGILSATCTLSGMLFGSLLTGKFVFNPSTINIPHAVFSLTPGLWEEVIFRGIIMIVLLKMTQSLRKAFWIQIAIFALVHIKGLDVLSFVDAFSVGIIAIAFTYSAVKTKSLLPGIIFHFLHDTFLYAVQLPDGVYTGFRNNAYFYGALWFGVLLSILLIKRISERFSIVNSYNTYDSAIPQPIKPHPITPYEKQLRRENITKKLLIINSIAFSTVILLDYKESDITVLLCLGLYAITNLYLFIRWEHVKHSFFYISHLVNAFITFVSAYDTYTKGSKRLPYAFAGIGIVYIILAYVFYTKYKKLQIKTEGSDVND